MKWSRMLAWLALMGMPASYAYIYEIQVMRRWMPQEQRFQYLIGCSDYHDKLNSANKWQRKELCNLLAGCNKSVTQVLLEDLSSPNDADTCACGHFFLRSERGMLARLTKEIEGLGVAVQNLEYRYCRAISLSGVLARWKANPYQFQPACAIRVSSFIDEIESTMDSIAQYEDGPALSALYAKECARVKYAAKQLGLTQASDQSVASFCARSRTHDRLAFLKRLLTFDSPLLDCKLVHAIVNAVEKDRIITIAGGTHIGRMCTMLQKVGFERVESSELPAPLGTSISQAVGLCITNRHDKKPEPISLELLKKFMK